MIFNKIYVLNLLLWYFIRSSMAYDFCETFAKNNFSIDYGFGGHYKYITRTDPQKGWLGIGDNFWKFDVNINNGTIDLDTKGSPLNVGLNISKEIKMTFIGIDDNFWKLYLNINNGSIDLDTKGSPLNGGPTSNMSKEMTVTEIDENIGLINKTDSKVNTSFEGNNTETKVEIKSEEKIGFNETGGRPSNFEPFNNSMIIAIMEQNYDPSLKEFERNVTLYHIFENGIDQLDIDQDSFEVTKTINNLNKSVEIIAILGPYMIEYKTINFNEILIPLSTQKFALFDESGDHRIYNLNGESAESYGQIFSQKFDYLFLIKVNQTIEYFFISELNTTVEYKTLIDCSQTQDNTTKSDLTARYKQLVIIVASIIGGALSASFLMVCLCFAYMSWSQRIRGLWFDNTTGTFETRNNPEYREEETEAILELNPQLLIEPIVEPITEPSVRPKVRSLRGIESEV